MSNTIKYDASSVIGNSIKSGNFNIGVNNTPVDLSGFYNGISPIIGGYTIYINKAENGPSIYAPKNDTELIDIANKLGAGVSTTADALNWIRSQSNMTVLNSNYPQIVTNGLALNLDAGFVSSYPKTGTTWTDLSGNGINGTLVNGPTFDSSNYGSIVFDGVNDVSTLPINTFTSGSPQNGTFILKLKTPPFDTTAQVIFFRDGGSTGNLIYFYRNAGWATNTYAWLIYSNAGANILYDVYLPDQWYETALTFDSQGNVKTYIDGVLRDSEVWDAGATSWNRSGSILPNLRCSSPGGPGNIQRFMYYTRALSASEILQNYNAGLQRFIPTDGLVLSLDAQNTNLYATSPTTAYDVSGNDNNGTLINGTQYVADGDGSWRFDGVDDQITNIGTLPTFSFIQNTGIFTICAWVRLTDLSAPSYFLGNNDGTASSKGFYLGYQGSSGRLWLSITYGVGGQATLNLQRTNFFLDDNWVFVTAVGNGTTCQFYRNGQTFSTSGTFGTFSTGDSTRTLGLGRINNFNGSYWEGNVSQTQIYNRALTQNEITTIYNATKSRYGIQ